MPATAADLPPDLFKNILDCLQTSSRSPYHGENSIVAVTKHELAACSLTCSYWATACRPRIFTHITLRSREDVYTLLSFIEQPNSPLPGYIKFIRISSVLSGLPQPWIYLVPLLSSPKLNPFIDKELYISQPLDSDGKDRVVDLNLHLALPSSVPSTPFIDFSDIALTDIHLNTYSDLSRFVRTTPFLGWLRCERIAWTTAQEETLLPGSSRTSYITYVTMEKCTENWKAMDLLLGATYLMFHLPGSFMEGRHPNGRQYRRLLLDVTERLSVVALVRSIQSVIDSEQSLQPYVSTSAEPFTGSVARILYDCINLGCTPAVSCTPMITFVLPSMIDHQSDPINPSSRSAPMKIRVEVILLDFIQYGLTLERIKAYDWVAFDKIASQMGHLQAVVMDLWSEEALSEFIDEVVRPKLTQLQCLNKLKCRCPHPNDEGKWTGDQLQEHIAAWVDDSEAGLLQERL